MRNGALELFASKLAPTEDLRYPVFSWSIATKNLLSPFPLHEQNAIAHAQEN
jgi:hypothetical protein